MKKSNEQAVTLVSLVITIIILAILGSITVYIGGNIIKKTSLQTINTNMMLIQAKVKTISEQAKFNKNTQGYKGTKISEVVNHPKVTELIENNLIEDQEKNYLLSMEDLHAMGLEKINLEDGYIVNYETDEIIYVKGFKSNNTVYYKLSEMKNLNIE